MATPQVIWASNTASISSTAISSTKVRVSVDGHAVYYAVGANPVAFSNNCEIIPAGTVRYVNMQGLGNKIAFLANDAVGTGLTGTVQSLVTVQQIGTVYPSGTAT